MLLFIYCFSLACLPFALQAKSVETKQKDLSISEDRGEARILGGEEG